MPISNAAIQLRDVPSTNPVHIANMAGRLVSPKVGLIRGVAHGIYRAQDPTCLSLGIAAPTMTPLFGGPYTGKAGGGGESLDLAIAATIGEAVERYCAHFYEPEDLTFASYRELGAAVAVHPDLLRLFSEDQVRNTSGTTRLDYYSEDSRIRWVQGYSLTHSRPRFVPAPLVYLRYDSIDGEARIGGNASTGLAAGGTLEEAILSGLCECIERDAFTISWLCRWPGRRIRIDDALLLERMQQGYYCDNPRVELAFFDITLNIPVPSVLSYMVRPSEFGPTLSVGSATRTRPELAVSKCLTEMGQFLPYARHLNSRLSSWVPDDDFSNVATFDHHCMLYLKRPELVEPALRPYRSASAEVPLSSMTHFRRESTVLSDIQECIRLLAEQGLEVVVVDITTADVEQVGLKVVRVIVPGLVNLHGNHALPYLGCSRLQGMLTTLNQDVSDPPFNELPHPFP